MKKVSKNFFEVTFVTALTLTMMAACGPSKTRPASNKAKATQEDQNTVTTQDENQTLNSLIPFSINITDQQTLVTLMQASLGEDAVNALLNNSQGPLDEKVDFGLHLSYGAQSADSDDKQISFLNFKSVLSNSVDKPMVLQLETKKSKVAATSSNDAGLELAASFIVVPADGDHKGLSLIFDGFVLDDQKAGSIYTGTISLSDDADVLIDREHKKTKELGTFNVPLKKIMGKEDITALKQLKRAPLHETIVVPQETVVFPQPTLKRATPAPAAEEPDKSLQ